MRMPDLMIVCALATALLAGPALAQPEPTTGWARYPDASEIQLRHLAAVVRVVPQARQDVALTIRNGGPLPDPQLRISRNRLIIDGRQSRRLSCRGEGEADFRVSAGGHGWLDPSELPVIEIRVPQDAVIASDGAVRLSIGPAESATVTVAGCGEAEIESVRGAADVTVAGAATLRLYQAGSARVAIAGAGNMRVGAVLDGLSVSIAGAGDFRAQRIDGPTNVAVQGAGDVSIREGRASVLTVAIAGAGDVSHGGSAERLDVTIIGAGDVRVSHVDGEINRRVIGGGNVVIGRR